MGEVVKATSKLTPEDRAAIAAYLATLPAVANSEATGHPARVLKNPSLIASAEPPGLS